MHLLATQYGEIFQLDLLGMILLLQRRVWLTRALDNVVINSRALLNEVSDPTDKVFSKKLNSSLMQVRQVGADGLFTLRSLSLVW
jgi:hypothetical protein